MVNEIELEIEGPEVGDGDEEIYTARTSFHSTRFGVKRVDSSGWMVWIEGIPDPAIVHDPWPTAEEAKDAAIKAVRDILKLEEMQRQDIEGGKPGPDEEAEGDEGVE